MARLSTPLSDRFGLEVPIFGFAHDIATVAAICNAGGLGVYGATRRFPHEIRDELAEIRRLVGDRPFGVDLVLPPGMPEHNSRAEIEAHIPDSHRQFVADMIDKYDVPEPSGPGMRTRFIRSTEIEAEQLEAVFESDVDLFACGIGAPRPAVDRARELGKATAALIGITPSRASGASNRASTSSSPKEPRPAPTRARSAPSRSCHRSSTRAATCRCSRRVAWPRVGTSQPRSPWARRASGTGTMWLTSAEHTAHMAPALVDKLLAATSSDTVITRSESGKTFRQIRSSWSDEWEAPGAPAPLKMPYQDVLVGDLLGAIDEHQVEPLLHSGAGQGIGYATEIRPVARIIDEVVAEAESVMTAWGNTA